MSIINMSVDTKSRQLAITVDGVLIPATEGYLHKFVHSDGTVDISLSYTVETESNNGLKETRTFTLPDPAALAELASDGSKIASVDKNGLISSVEPDSKVFASQLQDFLEKRKKD